jgi:hypothetical protein
MSGYEPMRASDLRCRKPFAFNQLHGLRPEFGGGFSRSRVDMRRLPRVALVAVEEKPIAIRTENARHIIQSASARGSRSPPSWVGSAASIAAKEMVPDISLLFKRHRVAGPSLASHDFLCGSKQSRGWSACAGHDTGRTYRRLTPSRPKIAC